MGGPRSPSGLSSPPAPSGSPALPSPQALRAGLEEFALQELVRQHRTSFPPLWSVESWAKLLIWLALNSGCPADGLARFAAALDPARSARLRRLFFSREREEEGLRLLADPADGPVQVQPLAPADADAALTAERIHTALEQVGLAERVEAEPQRWQRSEGLVAIPWR